MGDEQGVREPIRALAASAPVVLDPRLAEVWQLIWTETDESDTNGNGVPLDVLGGLIRLAYVQGYADALSEEDPGALFAELGVRSLSRTKQTARRRGNGRARPDSSDR